jgi:predicted RNA binding protein YcfA (HicA-like mRNA interferase family)
LGKLGVFSGKDVCAILSRHGFVCIRQKGSHIVVQSSDGGGTTTVPVSDHHEVRIGTLL